MDITTSLIIVAFAGLVHASFQLSVSVLTLLNGHALGAKRTNANIMRMSTSFIIGSAVMTILLLSFFSLVLLDLFRYEIPGIVWVIACSVSMGVAVTVWFFYYRPGKGTALWVPRGMADYLSERTKSTKLSAEAFGLGLSSVIGEILFIMAPMLITGLVLIQLAPFWQLVGLAIYTVISMISLIVVWILIGSGHSISQIQKWREENKKFMQFSSGLGLMILGFVIFAVEIIGKIGPI